MKIIKFTDKELSLLRECLTWNYLNYKGKINNDKFDFQKEKLEDIKKLNSKILAYDKESENIKILLQGNKGEREALKLLKKNGFLNVFQSDWIGTKDEKKYLFEVKYKELFTGIYCNKKYCDFDGTGTEIYQIKARLKFQNEKNIRAILLQYIIDNKTWYWQYLDKLEEGEYFDTENKIRIYPINNYKQIKDNHIWL